ncbi:protein-L-isoaspartate(D-aspartate) O-methyltransferase [Candidatus Solincola tengchongensis]|uniref:protein-L-isoaspartate(D-aspartate) O-methyltransferase n=1 Tax=Candidatus Solincola tengchongensis TaxID=2900693 RepID=UPI00257ED579|nr:protein-L-isoaspartate(D-aspartate) O-methyltransferase [Candidatus Solincola tengchongensis]
MDEEAFFRRLREEMVRTQIAERGIRNPRVLEAMRRVPRHLFVPEDLRHRAYEDTPLPIGEGQTISQPYMVAWMTELLDAGEGDRVLEIGTGSGYQAAVLCELVKEVYTIEKNLLLAREAEERLRSLGYANVRVRVGDGTLGWPEEAPFDGIIVTAGAPSVPQPLLEQLAEGGRLVIPVGSATMQMLTVVRKEDGAFRTTEEGSCIFVPLVGKYGWRRFR